MTTQSSNHQEGAKPNKPRVWVTLVLVILMIAKFCLREDRKKSEKVSREMAEIFKNYMKNVKSDEHKDKYLKYYTYTGALNKNDSILSVVYEIGIPDGEIATLVVTIDSTYASWYTNGEITERKSRKNSLNDISSIILKESVPSQNNMQKFDGYYSKPNSRQVIFYVRHVNSGIFCRKINLVGEKLDSSSEKIIANLVLLYKEMKY